MGVVSIFLIKVLSEPGEEIRLIPRFFIIYFFNYNIMKKLLIIVFVIIATFSCTKEKIINFKSIEFGKDYILDYDSNLKVEGYPARDIIIYIKDGDYSMTIEEDYLSGAIIQHVDSGMTINVNVSNPDQCNAGIEEE